MPMVPSPMAALAYATVKVVGYAVFAHQLNKIAGRNAGPVGFGFAKTAIGLVGGISYIAFLNLAFDAEHRGQPSDLAAFVGAAPVRLLAWSITLGIFYGFRTKPKIMTIAALLGVCWSYVLDGIMWCIYKVLPGMVVPWC